MPFTSATSAPPPQATDGTPPVAVAIDSIRQNDHIAGKVQGMTKSAMESSKVIVYVKTDKWYIHPYVQGEEGKSWEGKSWAAIDKDGYWTIETVFRGFPASAVAVLVVDRDYDPPPTSERIESIPHKVLQKKDLKGTDDYGHL